jgi:iron complex outermembrane receptor protein
MNSSAQLELNTTTRASAKRASRLAPPLATTWAARWLRWALLLTGLAALASGPARAAAAEATPAPGAGTGTGAGGGGSPAGDDLFGMNLDQLMKVEVPVVYGASKHEQKITEAPAAVSIITADDIRRHGHRTLADILRNVRGFYVTHDRAYHFIGVRGVNRPGDFGGRILITVDGHRMNDPIYDSALSGTEGFLDVDMIDRVEIIRGPGSSLYGNNAVFGVINIITRQAKSLAWGELSGSLGSLDTYIGRFTLGHTFTNGLEFIASGTLRDSAGHEKLRYREYDPINNGVAQDLDHDHGTHLFASLRYHGLTLSGGYNEREKEIPSAAVGVVFNEKPSLYHDQRAFAELKYTHDFAGDWNVLGRLYYDHYRYQGFYVFDYGLPPVGNPADFFENRDLSLSRFLGGEAQVTKTIASRHRLTLGGEFRNDLTLDLQNFDVTPRTVYLDTRNDADNYGLYGQAELQLAQPLALNAGVRYDHFKTFGDTVNPRAALIYTPWKDTTLKALYGQAFRAPNAFEFGYISPAYERNPNLKSEQVRSFEIVWEQGFARHYRLTTALFHNKIDDLITKQVNTNTSRFVFRNTDSVDTWGGELELEAHWANGLRARASYTYTDATDSASGDRLSNSPQHVGKLALSVPLYNERFHASLELQAMSDRLTVRNQRVGEYALCNFTLYSQELFKNLEASASLYNLFDQHYADPVAIDFRQKAIQQDGRQFRLKLTWKF